MNKKSWNQWRLFAVFLMWNRSPHPLKAEGTATSLWESSQKSGCSLNTSHLFFVLVRLFSKIIHFWKTMHKCLFFFFSPIQQEYLRFLSVPSLRLRVGVKRVLTSREGGLTLGDVCLAIQIFRQRGCRWGRMLAEASSQADPGCPHCVPWVLTEPRDGWADGEKKVQVLTGSSERRRALVRARGRVGPGVGPISRSLECLLCFRCCIRFFHNSRKLPTNLDFEIK